MLMMYRYRMILVEVSINEELLIVQELAIVTDGDSEVSIDGGTPK